MKCAESVMHVIYTLCFPRHIENEPVFDTRVDHKKIAKIPVELFFMIQDSAILQFV